MVDQDLGEFTDAQVGHGVISSRLRDGEGIISLEGGEIREWRVERRRLKVGRFEGYQVTIQLGAGWW
jgi:hypothetical protein